MPDPTISEFRSAIDNLYQHLWDLEEDKKQTNGKIAHLEKTLFYKCSHNWVTEPDTWPDELVNKRCTKCLLYNYRY